jgi:peptide/nickel transport system substrate-binding protein
MARPVADLQPGAGAGDLCLATTPTACAGHGRRRALLDEAGWTDTGGDGIRDKDGKKLSILYQTSTNAVRQDFQALIKQWWERDRRRGGTAQRRRRRLLRRRPGQPDTFQKFYADVEMYANNFDGTDPRSLSGAYTCDKIPRPETQWQGENINRFCDPAYDALVAELAARARSRSGRRDRQEAERHADQGQLCHHPAGGSWPRLGPFQHAGRRGAEHLGQRAVERGRLVPRQVI